MKDTSLYTVYRLISRCMEKYDQFPYVGRLDKKETCQTGVLIFKHAYKEKNKKQFI